MKLYIVVGSPNCRKVQAVSNSLGLEVEIEHLDFFNGDLMTPEFLHLNPNHMVPTLVDGDLSLWESNAIMQYLADQVPGNSLFPQAPKIRADIVRWQCWELAHYNKALGLLAFETVGKPVFLKQEPDAGAVAWAQQELAIFAPVLEAHLDGRNFIVGDNLTLADYSVAHVEVFKDEVPFDWSGYPNISSYYQRMHDEPNWASTAPPNMAEMGRSPQG